MRRWFSSSSSFSARTISRKFGSTLPLASAACWTPSHISCHESGSPARAAWDASCSPAGAGAGTGITAAGVAGAASGSLGEAGAGAGAGVADAVAAGGAGTAVTAGGVGAAWAAPMVMVVGAVQGAAAAPAPCSCTSLSYPVHNVNARGPTLISAPTRALTNTTKEILKGIFIIKIP